MTGLGLTYFTTVSVTEKGVREDMRFTKLV
jgi:hypothetical protein